jgi:hypothetical protein
MNNPMAIKGRQESGKARSSASFVDHGNPSGSMHEAASIGA